MFESRKANCPRGNLYLVLGTWYGVVVAVIWVLTSPAFAADSSARLESVPAKLTFSGLRQESQLVITGHYEAGRIADLTHTADYKSSNESVVRVSNGLAHPTGHGPRSAFIRIDDVKLEFKGKERNNDVVV